jgi:hypothetical protein
VWVDGRSVGEGDGVGVGGVGVGDLQATSPTARKIAHIIG